MVHEASDAVCVRRQFAVPGAGVSMRLGHSSGDNSNGYLLRSVSTLDSDCRQLTG